MNQPSMRLTSSARAVCLIIGALMACQFFSCRFSSPAGKKKNLFEGTNAQDASERIRQKTGADSVKVSHIEIRQDRLTIAIQDPNKPKNLDEYTYSNGAVTGPKPVETLVVGEQEFTADKKRLFDLGDINFGVIPEVCRKAAERAQIEDGKVELISIDWNSAQLTRSAEEQKRFKAEMDKLYQAEFDRGGDPFAVKKRELNDLAITWRIWVKGPRITKDFYADAHGNLANDPFQTGRGQVP